jgi:uncharacterized membrane protein
MMNDVTLARIVHVIAVIVWIGGVFMVTAVVLARGPKDWTPEDRLVVFESVERRFSWIARVATLLVGLSGLHMIWRLNLWDRFRDPAYWWMHAMVGLWGLFTFILFVAEPLFLHAAFQRRAASAPEAAFRTVRRLHWLLVILSFVTVAGAVAGSHGWFFF